MMAGVPQAAKQWLGELSLRYESRAGRTVIASRQHIGPLTVQKPLYPEGNICHTYILHPPGGVVGGDILNLNIHVDDDAHALITTPASGKFYRAADSLVAEQNNVLRIDRGGILEWLPQETILFSGSNVDLSTHIVLQGQARFCGWDIICLGRPASDDHYATGQCRQSFAIYREEVPLILERTVIDGGSEIISARWGLNGFTVSGIMCVTDADQSILELARDVMPVSDDLMVAASLVDDVLVCRCLGFHGIEVREALTRVWSAIRPAWSQTPAHVPRIWST